MCRRTVFFAFALGSGVGAVLALLLILAGQIVPVKADPGELYVAPDGDCGGASPCYDSVQAAVNAAEAGDVIKVATGVYTEVQSRPAPPGYSGSAVVTQVVYISKTVTVQGGYATANWTTPYSLTQPTTLDAQGQGRVVCIAGNISPTLEGLRITGGDAEVGGGIYVFYATATISGNWVFNNTATYGGGIGADYGGVTITGNMIVENRATGSGDWGGGGIMVDESSAIISSNAITGNVAVQGGGVFVARGETPIVSSNVVCSNTLYRRARRRWSILL